MYYYSTNNKSIRFSFKEAVLKGLSDDGGLFMPASIPTINKNFIENIESKTFQEVALEAAKGFIGDEIKGRDLEKIIADSINFDAPVVRLNDNNFILELFHGPTLAFKDFGARFMARTFSYFNKDNDEELFILVATSGDTGSAVANGFYLTEGIKVVILYPSGKISNIQEKQITTLDKNIIALEIDGTFDDCQKIVKSAFVDKEINKKLNLSSANSINIARLIPQSFYYLNAYKQVMKFRKKIVFSVPSGNFGNLTAGLFANEMGMNVKRFIAAVNSNKVFADYLVTGKLEPKPSIRTLSNAMDVGNPSNFLRIVDLYRNDFDRIRKNIYSKSFNDEQTISGIKEVYERFNYVIDPHGAVGYLASKDFLEKQGKENLVITLETAHPGKFVDIVKTALGIEVQIPERLEEYLKKEKKSVQLPSKFDDVKDFILNMS
jgi:threonine synthase